MVIGSLKNTERTELLNPLFKKLFDFVRTHDLRAVPAGRVVVDGDDLYINVCDTTLRAAADQKLEVHREYIDVHFPLDGDECMGWSEIQTIEADSDAPFDTKDDFAVYSEPASVYFTLHPGEFCVMFPEDAHAPIIGQGKLRKAIAKVRVK